MQFSYSSIERLEFEVYKLVAQTRDRHILYLWPKVLFPHSSAM